MIVRRTRQKCRVRFVLGGEGRVVGDDRCEMLSEEWEASHPVEAAERWRFVEGVL